MCGRRTFWYPTCCGNDKAQAALSREIQETVVVTTDGSHDLPWRVLHIITPVENEKQPHHADQPRLAKPSRGFITRNIICHADDFPKNLKSKKNGNV